MSSRRDFILRFVLQVVTLLGLGSGRTLRFPYM